MISGKVDINQIGKQKNGYAQFQDENDIEQNQETTKYSYSDGNLNKNKNNNEVVVIDTRKKQKNERKRSMLNIDMDNENHIYYIPDIKAGKNKAMKQLIVVSVVCVVFMIVEVVGGYLANSLAIMSDAAHLFSDVSGFFISIFSIYISKLPSDSDMTYGYSRAEVVGALTNVVFIWGLSIWLIVSAVQRVINREDIDPLLMLIVSLLGLCFNLVMMKVLHGHGHGHSHGHSHSHSHDHGHGHSHQHEHESHSHDHQNDHSHDHEHDNQSKSKHQQNENKKNKELKSLNNLNGQKNIDIQLKQKQQVSDKNNESNQNEQESNAHSHSHSHNDGHDHNHTENINLRAAMIHIIGDIIQSVGVIIAALIIYFFGEDYYLVDPLCTFLFTILVIFTTYPMAKEAVKVLMEGTPNNINTNKLRQELSQIKNVLKIHDFHVWSLTNQQPAISSHIVCQGNPQQVLREATKICKKHKIFHSTFQVEDYNDKSTYDFELCGENLNKNC